MDIMQYGYFGHRPWSLVQPLLLFGPASYALGEVYRRHNMLCHNR